MGLPPKSGNMWALATAFAVRGRGLGELKDVMIDIPAAEIPLCPGETLTQRRERLDAARDGHAFGIYRQSISPFLVGDKQPVPGVKYVLGVRNPIDAVASLRPFWDSFTDEFREMWGGFPPRSSSVAEFEAMIRARGLAAFFTGFFKGYLAPMLNYSQTHPDMVLVVHYADRIKDPRGDVQRWARFMGVALSPDELDRVLLQTSFKHMQAHERPFLMCEIMSACRARGFGRRGSSACVATPEKVVAKGAKRDGSLEHSPEFVQWVNAEVDKAVGPALGKWLREGGEVPVS